MGVVMTSQDPREDAPASLADKRTIMRAGSGRASSSGKSSIGLDSMVKGSPGGDVRVGVRPG